MLLQYKYAVPTFGVPISKAKLGLYVQLSNFPHIPPSPVPVNLPILSPSALVTKYPVLNNELFFDEMINSINDDVLDKFNMIDKKVLKKA